ncbi:uncharacterized protein LY89DRAFT_686479 [Mollisia scopiformis]|uniref:Uncharacterized protein n=1 Tax=Mollisia scopiformis TaxID=149040 RepID=A0A194X3T6_MOLSC|nr:uncharacterized protein LY89DRAFT_686479 [Mollisia scopiformis]KUJ14848.1 hypothetical protein LY89DRAFT_686479 [Mollisia scopiformis]
MKVSKLVTLLAVAGIPVLCKKRKSSTTSSKIVGTTTILDATTTAAPAIVTTASSEIPTNTSAAVDYFTVTSLTPEQVSTQPILGV